MPILTDVPVCACVSSQEEKKKRWNRADHLSLSEALSSEIEFSISAIVVVFVSGDRMVRFFFLMRYCITGSISNFIDL